MNDNDNTMKIDIKKGGVTNITVTEFDPDKPLREPVGISVYPKERRIMDAAQVRTFIISPSGRVWAVNDE